MKQELAEEGRGRNPEMWDEVRTGCIESHLHGVVGYSQVRVR